MQLKTFLLSALLLPSALASPAELVARKKKPKQIPSCAIFCFARLQTSHVMDCALDETLGVCLCERFHGVRYVTGCCAEASDRPKGELDAADKWITEKCSPYAGKH